MDAIAEYVQAKRDIATSKKWAALIGASYHGGGGGIGKVVGLDDIRMQIYHQSSNGAEGYHMAPCAHLKACIGLAMAKMAPTIIAQAIALMEQGLTDKAAAAKVLMIAIAADADGEPNVPDAAPSLSSTN